MMEQKLLGCILIETGAVLLGILTIHRRKIRRCILEEWYRMLISLKNQISYTAAPLDEIFEKFQYQNNGLLDDFYKELVSCLRENDSANFAKRWNQVIARQRKCWYLSQEEEYEFMELGNHLGGLDRKEQLEQMNWRLVCMERRIHLLREGQDAYSRFVLALTSLSGAMLIVFIL